MNKPTPLELSKPIKSYSESDPNIIAYLQGYGFPRGSNIRYGNQFFETHQRRNQVKLFGQTWIPPHARGTVLIIHGFGEHSGNYGKLVCDLVKAKYGVITLDLRGHGLSEGLRGHVDHFDHYVEDIQQWLEITRSTIPPSTPLYVWAHSLGSTIALKLLMSPQPWKKISGACLSSPMLGLPNVRGKKKLLMKVATLLYYIAPTLQISVDTPPAALSSNEDYLKKRLEDSLIHNKITPAWLRSARKAIQKLQVKAPEFSHACPILLLLSGREYVTNLGEARNFASNGLSNLKHKIIEFPQALHELEKDTVRSRVVQETLAWFNSHH